ncbi:hypothetical protein [Streptomyces nigrescens]
MNPRSPRARLRDALLRIGAGRHVPDTDLRTDAMMPYRIRRASRGRPERRAEIASAGR